MMSWIRSSELAVALTVLALLVGAAGVAGALSTSAEGVPENASVGSEVSATITIQDPYTEAPNQWELGGETGLTNVSWTVTELDQGQQISQETYGGQSFSRALARADGGDEVRIEVTGDVPAIENYSYRPAESTDVVRLSRTSGDNTQEVANWTTRPYTEQSQRARDAIASAEQAIESAGGGQDAQRSLQQAISAYNSANFENAVSNAEDAESAAEGAQQTQTLLYAGIGVVVLLVVIGGVYYWRQQQDDYDKLR